MLNRGCTTIVTVSVEQLEVPASAGTPASLTPASGGTPASGVGQPVASCLTSRTASSETVGKVAPGSVTIREITRARASIPRRNYKPQTTAPRGIASDWRWRDGDAAPEPGRNVVLAVRRPRARVACDRDQEKSSCNGLPSTPTPRSAASSALDVSYDGFTRALDSRLGKMPSDAGLAARSPAQVLETLASFVGPSGFVLFQKIDHGGLLTVLGGKSTQAATYVFGNALIAIEMTKIDPRAGLYVPLRMFVRGIGSRQIELTYDLPSALLGQFGSSTITTVAESLNRKVDQLVSDCASRAGAMAA